MSHHRNDEPTRRTTTTTPSHTQQGGLGDSYYRRSHHHHNGSSGGGYHPTRGPLRLRAIHRASLSGRLPPDYQEPSGGYPDSNDVVEDIVTSILSTGHDSNVSEDATAGASTFPSDPVRAQQQQQRQDDPTVHQVPSDRMDRYGASYSSMNSLHRMDSPPSASTTIFFLDGGLSDDPCPPKLGDRRSGHIDGHEIEFELCQGVNTKPNTSREERTAESTRDENATRSPILIRCRLYLMQFGFVSLSLLYLASFVALVTVFTALYYIPDGKCCDDPELTFREVFDFSVQTCSTIGYGGYVPKGAWANFLVVIQTCLAIILSAIYTGLLFTMFQTPHAKLDFSDVMVLSNFHGIPCLELRVGNADGSSNPLIDVEARMDCTYLMESKDEASGIVRDYTQSERLHLMAEHRASMNYIWTLRHCIDEHSPLLGMRLDEWPGSSILEFRVSLKATQEITDGKVSVQSVYQPVDVLVGYRFKDQVRTDEATKTLINDYSLMNEVEPQLVWYPVQKNKSHTFQLP